MFEDSNLKKESFLGELRNLREFARNQIIKNDEILSEVEFWTNAANDLIVMAENLEKLRRGINANN